LKELTATIQHQKMATKRFFF